MKPTLALFLELGGSFEGWNEVGFFSREISLYNRLARDFFGTIYVFTYGDEKDLSYGAALENNIIVIPRGKRSKNFIINFLYETYLPFRHLRLLRECDVFKTNQNSGSVAASIAKLLCPSKKLVIRSGYIGSELGRMELSGLARAYYFVSERLSYRLCDLALIPERDARILSVKYPFVADRIVSHNNFIDTDIFSKSPRPKRYDIIYVARLSDGKNHISLIRALKGSKKRILFIGSGPNRDRILELGVEYDVSTTILESIPNGLLPDYFNSALICAFPSLFEGNPKALLEAMACGLPVVALDSPGVTNIVTDGKNGLIGPPRSFRKNILRLLSDSSLRDTLGKAARATVLDGYAFENIVGKEIATYRKLLGL